jgi:chromosome partitioning protein
VTILAIANPKGGSAKTTTAVSIAGVLAESGRRVLLVDLDPQGAATDWLLPETRDASVLDAIDDYTAISKVATASTAPGLWVLSSPAGLASSGEEELRLTRGLLRLLEDERDSWDTIVIDPPSGLGQLAVAPLAVADQLVVPVEAHALALPGVRMAVDTMERVRTGLNATLRLAGIVACRVTRTAHSDAVLERLADHFPESLLRATVREDIRLAEAPSFRLPITRYAPRSTGAIDYRAVVAELGAREGVGAPD